MSVCQVLYLENPLGLQNAVTTTYWHPYTVVVYVLFSSASSRTASRQTYRNWQQ